MNQTFRSKDTVVQSLFSTVKKSKQSSQLHHAKSYDDIFASHQLEPYEVKILLHNDNSLKHSIKVNATQKLLKNPCMKEEFSQEKLHSNTGRQSRQVLLQVLQQSVKKQNILIKRNLFDPFKYFGSNGQLSSIQQSTRHHQSRLQAMFQQNNSLNAYDHNHSCRKKSPVIQMNTNAKKKINLDVNSISSTILMDKLQKLTQHELKVKDKDKDKAKAKAKENSAAKIIYGRKYSFKNLTDKENLTPNDFTYQSYQKEKITQKSSTLYLIDNHVDSKKSTQNHDDPILFSSKKMSLESKSATCRSKQVNCSPKSYVKDAKQKYLKMNLNSLQKVRLKLKLSSSKN